jgi:hypothetical protein
LVDGEKPILDSKTENDQNMKLLLIDNTNNNQEDDNQDSDNRSLMLSSIVFSFFYVKVLFSNLGLLY